MKPIKTMSFINVRLYFLAFCSIAMDIAIAFWLKDYLDIEYNDFIFITLMILAVMALLMGILLYISGVKNRDYTITESEIIQNKKVIATKSDIISIKKTSSLITEIKYSSEWGERKIQITVSNKKLNDILSILGFYN